MKVRIGTRGSKLALTQAWGVAGALHERGHEIEVVVIRTAGDLHKDKKYDEIGPPGIFVREIESALLRGEIDAAVHSYKDLPSRSPDGLVVGAVPERVDAADRLLALPEAIVAGGNGAAHHGEGCNGDGSHDEIHHGAALPPVAGAVLPLVAGAVIGTASERRRALLGALRPDLRTKPIRGNVPTRIAKLRRGSYQAIVLAAAGLARLQRDPVVGRALDELVNVRLDPQVFVPAPAQGAIAVQCRADDAVVAVLEPLHDATVAIAVRAERALLRLVEGGCNLPFGAWCRAVEGGAIELVAVLGGADGLVYARQRGAEADAADIAARAWEQLCDKIEAGAAAPAGVVERP